ncbi:unnamed protein product [Effrenium voratum]|uniref:Uncharacterized protein n=1 Tax=Effrenium voratum TaxID=2562239 RepID=A0AA36N2I5_9DINO|nr:unnamed protein product [Effrenium voratum]
MLLNRLPTPCRALKAPEEVFQSPADPFLPKWTLPRTPTRSESEGSPAIAKVASTSTAEVQTDTTSAPSCARCLAPPWWLLCLTLVSGLIWHGASYLASWQAQAECLVEAAILQEESCISSVRRCRTAMRKDVAPCRSEVYGGDGRERSKKWAAGSLGCVFFEGTPLTMWF